MTGAKPDFRSLVVFGCDAYVAIPHRFRNMLDDRAIKGIFVGYDRRSLAILFYDPASHRILKSRNVIFNESGFSGSVLRGTRKVGSKQSRTHVWTTEGVFSPDPIDLDLSIDVVPDTTVNSAVNDSLVPVMEESTAVPDNTDVAPESLNDDVDQGALPSVVTSDQPQPLSGVRRSTRQSTPSKWFGSDDWVLGKFAESVLADADFEFPEFAARLVDPDFDVNNLVEPKTQPESISGPDRELWMKANDSEIQSHKDNETYELGVLPKGWKAVKSKWVFKVKLLADGTIDKYKSRVVACGYSQKYGIDYEETFSPTPRMTEIKIIVALVVHFQWKTPDQVDVRTAFLNGVLDEEIWMEQPEGYEEFGPNGEKLHWRLKKSIYGLKQAGRTWHKMFAQFMKCFGFRQCGAGHCLFLLGKILDSDFIAVLVHVDDIVIAGPCSALKAKFRDFFGEGVHC